MFSKLTSKQALDILDNMSKGHIIYDTNLKEICYSAQFINAINKAKEVLRKEVTENE